MGRDLKDAVVVITGAAKNIGYEIANSFIAQGTRTVIVLDIDAQQGHAAVASLNSKYGNGKAAFIQCDVSKDLEAISKQIFETYKTVDVLVNNAGIVNEKSIRTVMEINAIAVMEWTMKYWEHMRTDKGGRGGTILNVSSIYSYVVDPFGPVYKSSKFAVMGFTRTLGHNLNFQKFGVRVIALCPGFTRTHLTEGRVTSFDEIKDEFKAHLETHLWQDAEDVGRAAVEVFGKADSGAAWKVIGGIVSELPLVADGDQLR